MALKYDIAAGNSGGIGIGSYANSNYNPGYTAGAKVKAGASEAQAAITSAKSIARFVDQNYKTWTAKRASDQAKMQSALDQLWSDQKAWAADALDHPNLNSPLADLAKTKISGGLSEIKDRLQKGLDPDYDAGGSPTPGSPTPAKPTPGSPTPSAPSTPFDYSNADIAKAYGMDAATAYQEALANTSYQRAVRDLQAAGLNPILATGNGGASSSAYGATVLSDGSVSFGGGSSAKAKSHTWYTLLTNVGTLVGAVLYPKNPFVGMTVGKTLLSSLGNLLDSIG